MLERTERHVSDIYGYATEKKEECYIEVSATEKKEERYIEGSGREKTEACCKDGSAREKKEACCRHSGECQGEERDILHIRKDTIQRSPIAKCAAKWP